MRSTPNGRAEGPPSGAHPDDDLLLDLALGVMTRGRAADLFTHLAACPACEERFRHCAGEVERLRAAAAGALAGLPEMPVGIAARRVTTRGRWAWMLGSAAALAACLLLFVTVVRPAHEKAADTHLLHWLPDPGELVVTRTPGGAAADPALTEGLASYRLRDMRAAAAALGKTRVSGPMAAMAAVYYGSALAWSGEYRAAARELAGVNMEALPEPWRGETRWTLYVAFRECGEAARADSLLTLMEAGKGTVADRARELHAGH